MFNGAFCSLFKYLTLLQISRALFCLTVPGMEGRMSTLMLKRDLGLTHCLCGNYFYYCTFKVKQCHQNKTSKI